MHLTLPFVALSLGSLTYAAIGPITNLYVANRIISPDGFNREAVTAGDTPDTATMPTPLIVGNIGDQFRINVINQLKDTSMITTTSIHWHGLFQKGTNWADGPVGVNQCPTVPGHSFLYQFHVPGQAGTFWYHSHHRTQYCDGLRGPLVVYDPYDPLKSMYDIDDDWYHIPAPLEPRIPIPASTLINGLARYAQGPNSPLAIINVRPNKRYRMRLVSVSCDLNFMFSIDNHNMTATESDGVSTNPVTVNQIQIFTGQRYSFVLNTNQPVGNYWVRVNPNSRNNGFANGINSAILRYGGADINLNINITVNSTSLRFEINGATFIPAPIPVLLQILSGARTAQELLPPGSVYVLPPGKSVEVSIPGGTPGSPHPFHLHGQTFDVVRSAGSPFYNYANPVRRDVVSTGLAGDNTTFRFSTDNPGPWILHCHIDWHLDLGLAIVFAVDANTTANFVPPNRWDQLCPIYNASGLP
ncbi:hypothetical protein AX15_004554 [Amanita polypyramis BW_CC]|nr:hypothetical protein AX15_004554 [Amanita polypyramis BW_CC]